MIMTMMNSRKERKIYGQKRKINFQEVVLRLELEERLMKESQADEDYMFLLSLLPPTK